MEGTMDELERVQRFSRRLALIMRAYGERMKRAEHSFTKWLRPKSAEDQLAMWDDYTRQMRRSDRLRRWHHQLALRAMGVPRG
jgi:hypothetical protein